MSRGERAQPIKVPEWKELFENAQFWEYGDIHSHREIAKIVGLQYPSEKFYHTVTRANKELLHIGKMLSCIQGKGYKVVEPNDYHKEIERETRRAERRAAVAMAIGEHAPYDEMDIATQMRTKHISDRALQNYAFLKSKRVEIHLLAREQPKLMVE